jgi:hypothetical protein
MERLARLRAHLTDTPKVLAGERLRVKDNRTGRVYEV